MRQTNKRGAHAGSELSRSGNVRSAILGAPRKFAIVAAAALVALCAVPAFALTSFLSESYEPTYGWYSTPSGNTYTLNTASDFIGFTNVVNGTAPTNVAASADSFSGKTVRLADNLNFSANALTPVGTETHPFDGIFDGNRKTIGNYTLLTASFDENVGLFGYTSTTSQLNNIIIGNNASLTLSRTAEQARPVKNIGLLVGRCGGSMSNCSATSNCSVNVSNAMDQTATVTFPIMNVGVLAGICLGNMSGCSNVAHIEVHETGGLYIPEDDDYVSVVAVNVGGLAGCVGTEDSSIIGTQAATPAYVGTISSCTNSGKVSVDTPRQGQIDRFGNQTYINAAAVGGIAGYSRGSVSGCSNSGVLDCLNTRDIGGIVGSLRACMDSSNFSSEGHDDGTSATPIVISGCTNSGNILSYACPGGIAGRTGTYTTVTACMNGVTPSGSLANTYVIGTRPTKPFVGGIVGSTYGSVSYCANFGTSVSAVHSQPIVIDSASPTYTAGGGYYVSGIVGLTEYYTDANNVRNQPLPEIYGCYMAGYVDAMANMRQRAIVGDNEGYAHDCVAVEGCGTTELFYTEGGTGTYENCHFVTDVQLKTNAAFDTATGATPFSVINGCGDATGWASYWALSNNNLNGGYPILNTQVSASLRASIVTATVAWAEDAEYTGGVAVPHATVTFNGTTLVEGVDYHVVPQANATAITTDRPYVGQVEGIGYYKDLATQTFNYGIGRGDLADFTVIIDSTDFNWVAQTISPSMVHVTNAQGTEIDSSQYDVVIDPSDTHLTNGQAINAAKYATIVTPSAGSTYFKGSNTSGVFIIKAVKIVWSDDTSSVHATTEKISYLGQEYDWQSTSASIPDSQLLQLEYTGSSIKPDVTKVTYLGRDLTYGVDYRVIYDSKMDGAHDANPNVNVGDGWVICRFAAGSNFTNYDLMKFKIVAQTAPHDISDATVQGDGDIVFEEGGVYEPITVWYGGSQLRKNTDYTITYQNNDRLGTASYTITGIGGGTSGFTGTKTGTFNLVAGTPYELQYSYDDSTHTAAVTGAVYNGSLSTFAIEIPSTVVKEGVTYNVTSIADNAFGGSSNQDFIDSAANLSKKKLASASIPASVTSIGSYAFGTVVTGLDMSQFTSVTFAENSRLKTIGDSAFNKTGITSVVIPAKVESIGKLAFAATSLTSVTFMTGSADKPAIDSGTTTNSFRYVSNVRVSSYNEATSVRTYVTSRSGSGWSWTSMGPAPALVKYGDVDGNDKVNSTDAMLVARYAAHLIDGTTVDLVAADVDGNNKVNSTDAMLIARYAARLINVFPVEQ